MKTRVYTLEDDENIRELIRWSLTTSGFEVEGFETGAAFLKAVEQSPCDLALIDVMLPDTSGLDVLAALRENPRLRELPVILVTARSSELDKVQGLTVGADDYITKPFGIMELTARIKALLRRTRGETRQEILHYRGYTIDTSSREVSLGERKIALTYKEFELLCYLVENRGRVLTREMILDRVWGYDFPGETRTVDMHIKTLRQKLGPDAENAIVTVRSVGYKLESE
ncbi:response regulator transcription factor [Feifania hominis]|uniref:Stage 0 sporulation protein A homolog n=1 Tax=Feifania hominis TaxID=2763660 RepID=A0A926DDR3_9FIRM|nr:response regulator transcription factor [Feifania hominis]MBC8536738.1 response regulator transcription factor [Feifania hominis]